MDILHPPDLDLRTILQFVGVLGSLTTAFLLLARRAFVSAVKGLGNWTRGFAAMFVASLLFSARGVLPDGVSIVLANALLIGGSAWVLVATRRMYGDRASVWPGATLLAGATALLIWFTFFDPHYGRRLMVSSAALSAVAGATCHLAWTRRRQSSAAWFVLFAASGQLAVQASRFASSFNRPAVDDFWAHSPFVIASFLAYAFSIGLMIVAVVLLAAERLREDLTPQAAAPTEHATAVAQDAPQREALVDLAGSDSAHGSAEVDARASHDGAAAKWPYEAAASPEQAQPPDSEADRALAERLYAVAIRGMPDARFGVTELARAVGLSPRQFQRRCRDLTNDGPLEYLRNVRMQEAHRLIQSRAYETVAEVAATVGLSPSHFTRLYVATHGRRPSDDLRK